MQEEDTSPSGRKKMSISDIYFKSKELERSGVDVIHLDVGEPDYEPPAEVINATTAALRAGKGRYTNPGGIVEVKNAISEHVNSKYGTNVSPKQVLFTSGGRLALFLAFASLPKDSKVGIISPDWPAYRDLSKFLSFRTTFFNTNLENDWNLDLGDIEESGCNVLVINYPNNPTGKILNPKLFDALIVLASKLGIKIISDEVYSDFVLNESKFKSVLETGGSSDYIFTTSLSKSYSMTGFRAAYLISDEKTISRLSQLNGLVLTSAPEFVQYGAIAALRNQEYVMDKVKMAKRRLDVARRALKELGIECYPPDGSLYLFPKLKYQSGKLFDSDQFVLDLLEKEHVSVTPGSVFGSEYGEFVRLTLLQSDERIREGIERVAHLLR